MDDLIHVGAGTRRLLDKQPSHQNSASLFLAFVAAGEETQIGSLKLNLLSNCGKTHPESPLDIRNSFDYIITLTSERGSRVIDRIQQSEVRAQKLL
jgi:hypothetical protein